MYLPVYRQLTWGVFPNCEILQPTIFDPDTFHVWKNEAFKVRAYVCTRLGSTQCACMRREPAMTHQ